jgi:succinate dehydrogenase / fumarate reductase cytochrome b subunit
MSWLTQTLTSSIGKKLLMALTGLFLCTFLVVHLSGNFQLFNADEGYSFNTYAVFMTTFPPIKVISYGNYFLILFHAFWGLYITYKNRQARPVAYAVSKNQSSVYSRNMAIFGTILLVYIVVHMSDFWYKYHYETLPYVQYTEEIATGQVQATAMPDSYTQEVKKVETADATTRTVIVKDLYKVVSFSFQNLGLVLFYVLAMGALAFHLIHGFQSAFQSIGLRHSKYTPLIKGISVWVFGILIPIGYAAMPLYFYFFK